MATTYTVRSGDTLSAIGKQLGVAYKQITGYKSGNPNLIYPGEVLTLPGAAPAAAAAASGPNSVAALTNSNSDINKTLDQYQSGLFQQATAPEVRVPTMDELKTQLAPTTSRPEPLNRVAEFEKLRSEYGVTDLEKSLTDLRAEQDQLAADFKGQRVNEEGKPVALNVIQGRVGEEERAYLDRQDYLGRQIARTTSELQTKYSIIQNYSQLQGLDYQDAVHSYEQEYTQNLQMYNLITGAKKEQRDAQQADQAAARANLQTMVNLASSGNLSFDQMPAEQKTLINKLEVQAGLPVGFISSIKTDPKANILFTSSNEGVTQVGFRNPDGTIKVESYGARSSSSTATERQQSLENAAAVNLYSATVKSAMERGATPEQAVQAAVAIANNVGSKLDLKNQGALLDEARKIAGQKTTTSQSTTQPSGVTSTLPKSNFLGDAVNKVTSFFGSLFSK